jgi:hypothetical protein
MSPRGDRFRAHALTAETSARMASDPEVKRQFFSIAQSWYALADMVDKGKVVELPGSTEKPSGI